jgi:hypothetical protein
VRPSHLPFSPFHTPLTFHAASITTWEFCNTHVIASKYSFRGYEYIKGAAIHADWTIRTGGTYDYSSITHYGTSTDGNDDCVGHGERKDCALMRYKGDPNSRSKGNGDVEWMDEYQKPSTQDVVWLKRMYPWMDPSE